VIVVSVVSIGILVTVLIYCVLKSLCACLSGYKDDIADLENQRGQHERRSDLLIASRQQESTSLLAPKAGRQFQGGYSAIAATPGRSQESIAPSLGPPPEISRQGPQDFPSSAELQSFISHAQQECTTVSFDRPVRLVEAWKLVSTDLLVDIPPALTSNPGQISLHDLQRCAVDPNRLTFAQLIIEKASQWPDLTGVIVEYIAPLA